MKPYIFAFFIVVLMVACGKKENQQQETVSSTDEILTPVQLTKIEAVSRSESITASGLVASSEEAKLSFKIGGIIQKIYVTEGQKVRKGQVLASLNMTEIDAQVSQAKYSVEKGRARF
jgi:multidrug efflux system membrane fusion protein